MAVVLPEHNAVVMRLRDPSKVTDVIPKHKVIYHEGVPFVAVPHTLDSMRVLRSLGINVRGCEVLKHKYPLPKVKGEHAPKAHQIDTAAFLTENPRSFCLNEPRTGKTASVLMAIDFLRRQRKTKAALVVCPMSCMRAVWEAEAFGMFPHWSVAVLYGSKVDRVKLLKRDYDLFVINPDGIKVICKELHEAIKAGRINVIVLDESTDFANSQADRWKAVNTLTKAAEYVWPLTGTPGDPEQVYGQIKLLNPNKVPTSFRWWRDMTMTKVSTFKWRPRPGYLDIVEAAMQPAIRFAKKDVLDLPPMQFLEYDAPLSDEQHTLYEKLRKDMVATTANGLQIVADNAAIMTSKLLQVATGSVKMGEDVTVLDVRGRMEVLRQVIRESEYKVVVFAPYKATLVMLEEELRKDMGVVRVDGTVTDTRRTAAFNKFMQDPDIRVLVAHPRTTAYGLEFGMADSIVFWGPPMNGPFIYAQAIERINSPLQKSKSPAIIHLSSTYVERRLFKAIKEGVAIDKEIVELFRDIVTEGLQVKT